MKLNCKKCQKETFHIHGANEGYMVCYECQTVKYIGDQKEFKEKSYVEFNELDYPDRKTKVFEVKAEDGFFLGTIAWRNTWRRYVFSPTQAEAHDLDENCGFEIFGFIRKLMQERK